MDPSLSSPPPHDNCNSVFIKIRSFQELVDRNESLLHDLWGSLPMFRVIIPRLLYDRCHHIGLAMNHGEDSLYDVV